MSFLFLIKCFVCDLGLHHLPQPRSVGESRTELGARACQFRALQKNKIHLDGGVSRRHRTGKEKLSMKNEGRGADGRREPQFSARYCKRAKKSVSKNNHEIAVRNGTKKNLVLFLKMNLEYKLKPN